MIFGGYGRKTKHRGDLVYPCVSCLRLNTFGLVESYGYGQLYGVRLAKVGTNRFMLCSQCRSGYELTKEQWQQALRLSNELKAASHRLTDSEVGRYAVITAQTLFPADVDAVSELVGSEHGDLLALPAGGRAEITAQGQFRESPSEEVDVSKLIAEARRLARLGDRRTTKPLSDGVDAAVDAGDVGALRTVALAAEELADSVPASSGLRSPLLGIGERAMHEARQLEEEMNPSIAENAEFQDFQSASNAEEHLVKSDTDRHVSGQVEPPVGDESVPAGILIGREADTTGLNLDTMTTTPESYTRAEITAFARRRGLDLDALIEEAAARLDADFEDDESLSDEDALRRCRAEVVTATGFLEPSSPVGRAKTAWEAANATYDADTIMAAGRYYDRKLKDAVADNGLSPLVSYLLDELFNFEEGQHGQRQADEGASDI